MDSSTSLKNGKKRWGNCMEGGSTLKRDHQNLNYEGITDNGYKKW